MDTQGGVIEPFDPYWDNVVALLPLKNNQNNLVTDGIIFSSENLSYTEDERFGTVAHFTANTRLYHTTNFAMGVNTSFTIELFVKMNREDAEGMAFLSFSLEGSATNPRIGLTRYGSERMLQFTSGSHGTAFRTGVLPMDANKWYHVALVYDAVSTNDNYFAFLDGQISYQAKLSKAAINSTRLNVGYMYYGTHRYLEGRASNFRFTKGVARYTENFTPPTEPFPNRGP